ncbi:hypothetical protein EHQ68_06110 [Leptospira congkakensis]|uniref:Porin n=1 Tax=Leptospira congkakensis TaxID=2484932 RepID=A0A4Z1AE49_9LEPT|nr:hypothetical protein [Leptospira congkakensis]TGL90981.1 hypothetical protein EHQ69_13870 [Leptospira congkakensis]TGL91990.1 hypothetical protein EHQ68_06110 [Leptospira congkakensis]TGL99040.1 hypothetical protein EHQ70_05705 [Leptospira congkakensis]
MKKIILLFVVLANSVLFADDKKDSSVYFRGVNLTVDSATLKNGLTMPNALIFNNLVGGSTNFSIPATNLFKGQGIEMGTNMRHNGLLGTDIGISFATLFADSNFRTDYSSSSTRIGFGPTAMVSSNESIAMREYTSNRLQTANIKIAENIYLFHDSGNRFLEGLALRLGGEIYGNEVKTKTPYSFNSSNATLNGMNISTVGINGSSVSQLTYNEAYLNAVVGLGYNLKIAEGHNISFGYEYLKSVANSGNYVDKTRSLTALTTNILIPGNSKVKGKIDSELEGNRISVGYRFDVSENVSFGISYSHTEATHKVVDSKIKGAGNISTLFSEGLSGNINLIPLILGSQPGFGPFPENKDIRRQIGINIVYKF